MRITLSTATPAEMAGRPGGESGLVIYTDIMGLRPLFDEHCETLSEQLGWPVCAVEMFPGQTDLPLEGRQPAAAGFDDKDKLADAQAAEAQLGAEKTNVMGFCMGGMYALKAASHFHKAVSFYGMIRVPPRWSSASQGEPLELMGNGSNVLALLGGKDSLTPPGDIEALKLTRATVIVYPEAEHGFAHDPNRPAHRPQDASDAWTRAVDFLKS